MHILRTQWLVLQKKSQNPFWDSNIFVYEYMKSAQGSVHYVVYTLEAKTVTVEVYKKKKSIFVFGGLKTTILLLL